MLYNWSYLCVCINLYRPMEIRKFRGCVKKSFPCASRLKVSGTVFKYRDESLRNVIAPIRRVFYVTITREPCFFRCSIYANDASRYHNRRKRWRIDQIASFSFFYHRGPILQRFSAHLHFYPRGFCSFSSSVLSFLRRKPLFLLVSFRAASTGDPFNAVLCTRPTSWVLDRS